MINVDYSQMNKGFWGFGVLVVDDDYSLVPLVYLAVVEVVGGLLHLRQIVAPVLKASTASSLPTVLVSPHTEQVI